MDLQGFSSEIIEAVKESITVARNRNSNGGRTYKYEMVALFARIWFLKAQILGSTVTEGFIQGLRDGSKFLLTSFSPKFKEMLNLVEQVPVQVEFQNGKNNMVRDFLYKFLVQSMLLKSEVFLSELGLMHETSRRRIAALQEGIVFLIKLEFDINHQLKKEEAEVERLALDQSCYDSVDERQVLSEIEHLAADVISLCGSLSEPEIHGLLEKTGALKSKLRRLYFQRPDSEFPKTPGVGPVTVLLERLKGMRMQEEHVSAAYQIEDICTDLELCLELCLKHCDEKLRAKLVETCYQVDHVIDYIGGKRYSESLLLMWLYDQSLVIKDLLTILHHHKSSTGPAPRPRDLEMPITRQSILESNTKMSFNEETTPMVGFDDEKRAIINHLTRGTKRLEVVSITGMACAGKSTLARDVFMTPSVRRHFSVLAWCTVSQVHTKYDILLEIYQMIRTNYHIDSHFDLEDQLRKSLKGHRYLIVMDDVWSSEVFTDLRLCFPDDSRQSRILMTSRNVNVVQNPYPLRRLTEEESCELLRLRIFGDKSWPSECLEAVKRIAQLCKGLPLAIVSVANILSSLEWHSWSGVAEEIYTQISKDPVIMKTVDLSYLDLPDDLKECFLYFGMCPKDEDILVRKLLWLWIAEGLVRKVDSRSVADLAEEYLMILIDRNLVSVTKLGSNGKVKKCRVQSVLLELCLLKAKDANFHGILNVDSDAPDFRISAKHRVTVFGDPYKFIVSKPFGTYVRSLLHFGTDEIYPGCCSDMLFVSEKFEILKVMSLESINVGYTLENDIGLPVYLRYLALGGDMNSLPSCVPKLEYLQTLIVKGLMNKFVVPSTIWSMKSLRHIDVSNHCLFTLQNDGTGTLDSLVSLSMPSFLYVKETDYIFTRFPNLRKLKCILLEPCVGSMQISQFPAFGSLLHLESLKLRYHGWPLKTVQWNLPRSLKELSLSNFRLPWEEISAIGELPNLEVLKLISNAFEGTTWEMEEGGFRKLRSLELVSLNFVHWYADEDEEHLRSLEHLVLRNCKQLKEVPADFGQIYNLQRIDAHECGDSVKESVRSIVETQLEFGNAVYYQ